MKKYDKQFIEIAKSLGIKAHQTENELTMKYCKDCTDNELLIDINNNHRVCDICGRCYQMDNEDLESFANGVYYYKSHHALYFQTSLKRFNFNYELKTKLTLLYEKNIDIIRMLFQSNEYYRCNHTFLIYQFLLDIDKNKANEFRYYMSDLSREKYFGIWKIIKSHPCYYHYNQ